MSTLLNNNNTESETAKRPVGRPKIDKPPKEKKPIGRPKKVDSMIISEDISSEYKTSDKEMAKRLLIVMKDLNLSYREFAAVLSTPKDAVSHTYLQKVIEGGAGAGRRLITKLIFILGYSPLWVLAGVGSKKQKAEHTKKIVTDFNELKMQIVVRDKELDVLKHQIDILFNEIAYLKTLLK